MYKSMAVDNIANALLDFLYYRDILYAITKKKSEKNHFHNNAHADSGNGIGADKR